MSHPSFAYLIVEMQMMRLNAEIYIPPLQF